MLQLGGQTAAARAIRSGFFALLFAFPASSASGQIVEFPVPPEADALFEIAPGADGNLWFTAGNTHNIGRITLDGVITLFPLPPGGFNPWAITPGPDGALWFTANGKIGRITVSGSVTLFPVGPDGSPMFDITTGPDGNLWYTKSSYGNPPVNGIDRIGRITPSGTVTEFFLPPVSQPYGIASGPDGNVWFTEMGSNKIGRITPSGAITEFSIPSPGSNPRGIAPGPDGNVWFIESNSGSVGRITPSGSITEFSSIGSTAEGIVAGPDGNLWFTVFSLGKIGRITPGGVISEFPTSPLAGPWGITQGPDGRIWFVEAASNKVARFSVCSPAFRAGVTTPCPTRHYTLTPCRVLDTRDAPGPYGGPALAANSERPLALSDRCGIPPSAAALSINLTVTQPSAPGHLTLFPAGSPLPGTSTINYEAGQTRANNAIVPLGSTGGVSLRCVQTAGTVQAILDVNGYFE